MAKILIVDDDRHLLELMAHRLSTAGHECQVALDGTMALKRFQGDPADLIVLDLMLPGMSGFEICRRVRADANWYTVPVLFISAMSSKQEVDHGLAQGADDFISKPFQIDNFAARVETLLANRVADRLIDQLTTLPGSAGMKLRVQNLVNHRKTFALVYTELLGVREFGQQVKDEDRARALRHFARVLHQSGGKLDDSRQFEIGHMGGGHFVTIIEPDLVEAYVDAAMSGWESYLPSFFERVGKPELIKEGREPDSECPVPMLGALFCSTKHSKSHVTTAQKLFETLSRLRATAHKQGVSGHFRDRRG